MIINSLKLENIRSYLSQEVEFPQGSTLLIGDIGSGKTTILLAIEFALFGSRRTDLSAISLLRHGKQTGSVELKAVIDSKEVIIKRSLKRGKSSISQESGFIIINNEKIEGTPIELKSKILQLIGYPEELLTKSKSLIYRYTVFTPQEEMKIILFESPEERINTLRRIFNIDRYKRIKENLLLYLRELRVSKRILESRIESLDELAERKAGFEVQAKNLKARFEENKPLLDEISKELNEKLGLQENLEKELRQNNELRQKISINEQKIIHLRSQMEKNISSVAELENQYSELQEKTKQKFPEMDVEDYKQKLSKAMQKSQSERDALFKQVSAAELRILSASKIISSISELENCPTCLQKVDESHKSHIIKEQKEHIWVAQQEKTKNQEALAGINKKIELQKQAEKKIAKIEMEKKEMEFWHKSLEEKQSMIKKLKSENLEIQQKIIDFKAGQEALKKQLKQEDREKIETFKALIDALRKNQRKKEILIAGIAKELELFSRQIIQIEKELAEKQDQKKSLENLSKYESWIEKFLLNVIDVIEKSVFTAIHRDFDETFRAWFKEIIDDETLDVRLDETFTPVVEQNGYETFLENLSGGEKTSVALAFRLALNKVINEFITSIKTNDLIILDEPTDGFSSEQLDRMRDVFEKLNMKQTIIVSHEPKMESYVENVLRVVKRDHVSRVLA